MKNIYYNVVTGLLKSRKVKNIIRQNKKSALQEFLFGKSEDSKLENHTSNPRIKILEDKIQNLSNQVDSLQL